jgi:hypothetical protein
MAGSSNAVTTATRNKYFANDLGRMSSLLEEIAINMTITVTAHPSFLRKQESIRIILSSFLRKQE